MLKRLNGYNWREVFEYAAPSLCEAGHEHGRPEAVIASQIFTTPFTREDVEEIIAICDGARDDDSWVGVFKLKDGRFASIRAGCDYSGWG